jgi:hypothetical protein
VRGNFVPADRKPNPGERKLYLYVEAPDGVAVPGRPLPALPPAPTDCDAFGLIGTTFRALDWKTLIFFERAVPMSPNAW